MECHLKYYVIITLLLFCVLLGCLIHNILVSDEVWQQATDERPTLEQYNDAIKNLELRNDGAIEWIDPVTGELIDVSPADENTIKLYEGDDDGFKDHISKKLQEAQSISGPVTTAAFLSFGVSGYATCCKRESGRAAKILTVALVCFLIVLLSTSAVGVNAHSSSLGPAIVFGVVGVFATIGFFVAVLSPQDRLKASSVNPTGTGNDIRRRLPSSEVYPMIPLGIFVLCSLAYALCRCRKDSKQQVQRTQGIIPLHN